jgi:hypothetical protein
MHFLTSTSIFLGAFVELNVLAGPSPKSFQASPAIAKFIPAILAHCANGAKESVAATFPPNSASHAKVKIFTDIPVFLRMYLF